MILYLWIFKYLPVSCDSIYISAPYSLIPQILDIDDEIAQPDSNRDSSDHDSDSINERVSPATEDVETIDFGIEDQPRELKIGPPLSTDERDRLIHFSSHTWMFLHGLMRTGSGSLYSPTPSAYLATCQTR